MNQRSSRRAVAVVLAAAALAVTGCKKEQPAEPPEPGMGKQVPPPAAQQQGEAKPAEQTKITINDDVVNRYLAYWDQYMELIRQVSSEVDTTMKEAQAKGEVRGTMHAFNRAQEIERKLDEQSEKLRREFRFTQREVDQLQDFFGTLAVNMQLSKGMQVDQMVAGLRQQLAQLPEEERAAAEAEIAQLESEFKAQTEFRELRDQYGDQAVDEALKHQDRIVAMQEKQLKLLGNVHQEP